MTTILLVWGAGVTGMTLGFGLCALLVMSKQADRAASNAQTASSASPAS